MANPLGILQIRISRLKVYIIMAVILIITANVFVYSYITQNEPQYTLPGIVTGQAAKPSPQFVIYGGFGDKQLNKPMAVASGNEKVYVSDTLNARVQIFNTSGVPISTFGKRGYEKGEFQFPYGIATDTKGQIYVADLYTGSISVFNAEGKFIKYFAEVKPSDKVIDGPGALVIKDNRLYVADIYANKVKVFDLNGKLLVSIGSQKGNKEGQLNAPNYLTVNDQGNIYVSDTGNARVNIYDKSGKFIKSFNGAASKSAPSLFSNPRGIAIDSKGRVFVVDSLTQMVVVFDKDGKELLRFGSMGDQLNQFVLPNGLCIDDSDRIYITDTGNARVTVYR